LKPEWSIAPPSVEGAMRPFADDYAPEIQKNDGKSQLPGNKGISSQQFFDQYVIKERDTILLPPIPCDVEVGRVPRGLLYVSCSGVWVPVSGACSNFFKSLISFFCSFFMANTACLKR
jgi:hypothetical protein